MLKIALPAAALIIVAVLGIVFFANDMSEAETIETKELTDLQKAVTWQGHTEPPFENEYWDNYEEGIYVDLYTGEALFSSTDKYDSGTGWPSFTKPIDEEEIVEKEDDTLGMKRTEVKSTGSDSHLGHVFDDGPGPTGERFCINSAAMEFVPKAEMEERGYEEYLHLFD